MLALVFCFQLGLMCCTTLIVQSCHFQQTWRWFQLLVHCHVGAIYSSGRSMQKVEWGEGIATVWNSPLPHSITNKPSFGCFVTFGRLISIVFRPFRSGIALAYLSTPVLNWIIVQVATYNYHFVEVRMAVRGGGWGAAEYALADYAGIILA